MSLPTEDPDPFDRERELAFVRAVMARHPAAVATFIERMHWVPRMLGALNARHGRALGADDLADLFHDTMEITLRKLGEFPGFGSFESWLHRLCNLEFLNAIRRKARTQRRTVSIEGADGEVPGACGTHHAHDDVHLALERLGGVEAEVIRLHYFEELTFHEIGRRLAVPANTAKTRFHRGMTKLAAILQTCCREQQA